MNIQNIRLSRRNMLGAVATTGAATALAACGDSDGTTPDGGLNEDGSSDSGTNPNAADIATLNALITAEGQAIDAYTQGAGVIDAATNSDSLFALKDALKAIAVHFQQSHKDHGVLLANTVTALGGTPVDINAQTFTLPPGFQAKIVNVLSLAANAEKGAAIAYNGAVGALTASANRFVAATIQGDESQHFIVLYSILRGLVAPGSGLTVATATDVVPASFVAAVTGVPNSDSLADIPDFDLTT